jgi:hypothetical protein
MIYLNFKVKNSVSKYYLGGCCVLKRSLHIHSSSYLRKSITHWPLRLLPVTNVLVSENLNLKTADLIM